MPWNAAYGALALALALSPLPGLAASEPTAAYSFEGMKFEVPGDGSGWTRRQFADGVLVQKMSPPDKAGRSTGGSIFQIAKPDISGTKFDVAFRRFVEGMQQLRGLKPLSTSSGVTINGHPVFVEQYCCRASNDVKTNVLAMGVQAPKSSHFLMMMMINLNDDDQRAATAVFEAIARSLQPTPDDKPFALVASAAVDELEGAFTHLDTGLRPNVFGGLDFYAESRIFMFNGRGVYSREIPAGGQGIVEYCQTSPQRCGLYALGGSGNARTIVINDVNEASGIFQPETKAFQRAGEDIKLGETTWFRVPQLPRGTLFDGTWTYTFAQSGQMASSSGGVAVQRTLTLGRDGRFKRTGYTSFMSTNETGSGTTSVTGGKAKPSETGRYAVEGYRISLTGDDGQVEVRSLFKPDAKDDGLLIIDGANYLKQTDK